jgi:Right handed beta helix region
MARLWSSCRILLTLGCVVALGLVVIGGSGCEKGAARQCDERVGCPPPLTCDLGSNQCVGESDNVTCSKMEDCSGKKPFCDLAFNKCVPCLTDGDSNECAGRLLCEKTECIACQEDTDCDGTLCLRSGGCAAPDSVAVVITTGTDNATCAPATPCATLAAALASGRPNIRVGLGTFTATAPLTITRAVAIYGFKEGITTLTRSGAGPIFDISGAGTVELRDLHLTGATGATGHGISVSGGTPTVDLDNVTVLSNAGMGISGGAAVVKASQSIIAGNAGGGISTTGIVSLVNNIVAKNGTAGGAVGGVKLGSAAANVVRFNTIVDNLAVGTGSGVSCGSTDVRLSSNIFASNGGTTGNTVAGCTTAYSLFSTAAPGTGAMDKTGDPKFRSTALPVTADFYRIAADSKAISGGEPLADKESLNDIDGDPRSNTDTEIGADEFKAAISPAP